MLAAGDRAPSFTLQTADGSSHSLASMIEQGPVLLAIFKISCPVCQLALPFLQRMAAGRLPIVGISQDGPIGTARFNQAYAPTLTTLLDREEDNYAVSNAFGITHVPSLFLVEADGEISLAFNGFSKSELETVGQRAGIAPFTAEDNVPQWKAG